MNIGPAIFAPARSLMEDDGIGFLLRDFSSSTSNLQRYCSSDSWTGAVQSSNAPSAADGVIESIGTKYTMFLPNGTP